MWSLSEQKECNLRDICSYFTFAVFRVKEDFVKHFRITSNDITTCFGYDLAPLSSVNYTNIGNFI